MSFEKLFNPKSVVLFGARPEHARVGGALMANLLSSGKRDIFPISSDLNEVLGIPAKRTLDEVAAVIDLAVIAIKADSVPETLRTCGERGIKNAIVISAGFKEAGEHGITLEEELHQVAKNYEINLLGPNCLGLIDAHAGLNATFAAHDALPGHIAFLSQSGAIGTALLEWARKEKVGFSKFISLGNEAGISEVEMLEYLGDDEQTSAILMYLEHVSDGERFLKALEHITPRKPIIILRAGRSARGAQAVMSHTGSLAPEDAVFTAACRQAGAATATTLRELFNTAKLLSLRTDWAVRTRIAIVTNGGGPSVNTADLIELSESLELVRFDEATKEALRSVLPPMAAVGNPVDVIGDAGSDRYQKALGILTPKDDIDAIIVIVTPQMMTDSSQIANVVLEANARKPIIPVFMGNDVLKDGISTLNEHGLVNFEFPSDAVEALDVISPRRKPILPVTKKAADVREVMLGFEETTSLLAEYGMSVYGALAHTKDELRGVFSKLSSPTVAMKVVSRDVIHKTESSAVRLNIGSAEEANRVWDEISTSVLATSPHAHIDGMLLQPMLRGKEVIIGMKRDATFGPIVIFGLGGIFVEVLRDVTMCIAPFATADALRMIEEVAGASYLGGFRGAQPVAKEKLAQILVSISTLAHEHPEILEIDLNPLIATTKEAYIVDARLMKKGK